MFFRCLLWCFRDGFSWSFKENVVVNILVVFCFQTQLFETLFPLLLPFVFSAGQQLL